MDKKKLFSFQLDEKTSQRLSQMAAESGQSKAKIIRSAIKAKYKRGKK